MWIAITALLSGILGFLAGLATLRRSERWCPQCGSTTACPDCRPAQRAV